MKKKWKKKPFPFICTCTRTSTCTSSSIENVGSIQFKPIIRVEWESERVSSLSRRRLAVRVQLRVQWRLRVRVPLFLRHPDGAVLRVSAPVRTRRELVGATSGGRQFHYSQFHTIHNYARLNSSVLSFTTNTKTTRMIFSLRSNLKSWSKTCVV